MSVASNSVTLVHGSTTLDAKGVRKHYHQKAARRLLDREFGSDSGSYRSMATGTTRWRHQRVSNSNTVKSQPVEYANTYRLGPERHRRFSSSSVEGVTRRVLHHELHDKQYDARECSKQAQVLCERIKHAVKELDFPRYKIVCNVVVGEKKGQGVHVKSRSVWDAKLDGFAEATFENGSLFAVATVYGAYRE